MPVEYKGDDFVGAYLTGTPLKQLFEPDISFDFDDKTHGAFSSLRQSDGDIASQCSRVDGTLPTMPDEVRHDASYSPRPSATTYTLSLEETALRFVEAGLPRNIRSLQRALTR